MRKTDYSRKIRERVDRAKNGTIFVMPDFADIAPNNAGNRVIRRLVEDGVLRVVVRGVYVKPVFNAFLGEVEQPMAEEVAKAIGRKNGWVVRPDGDMALNLLGLSTQVPAVWSFVSNGPYKSYAYGAGRIVLKHTANRLMSNLSWDAAQLVQALRAIGEPHVDDALLRRLSTRFSPIRIDELLKEMSTAPDWIREKIRKLKECAHE